MFNEQLFVSHFVGENIPTWPCPNCGSHSLSCTKDQFQKSYQTPIDQNHPNFDPEWIEYVFSMNLKCSVTKCSSHVMCVGYGGVSQEYLHDGSGDWDWFDSFAVTFFEPPLQIFVPPKKTPLDVKNSLKTSFSTFFSSPSTSLTHLRSSLEVLLSEMEVPSVNGKGRFFKLEERIKLLPEEFREIIEPANAIRWLGNDGTHAGYQVRKSDVLDGYRIFEHILKELYPEQNAPIEELVKRINDAKGIGKKN
jgi:hypothetical protein